MGRRILEIGPGSNPLHHLRNKQGRVKPFELMPDEEYVAIDLWKRIFEDRIWHNIKTQYPNQVYTVLGDREILPFKDEEFDEIIALGAFSENLDGIDRIIKKDGIYRIGFFSSFQKDDLVKQLENANYELINEIVHVDKQVESEPLSYVILTFKKKS